ncbi:hypothetical protein K501DRAFT_187199, partial [Backusella circina FSU 941]
KDFVHRLLHVEVKGTNVIKNTNIHHLDFVKVCNLLKGEIDLLVMEDYLEEIPVFGVLIGSKLML